LLERLRFLAWPSSIARTLVPNDPTLRSINADYRGLADERRDTLHHLIFYETRGTPAGVIVDEASADPGLSGRPPIPIDGDHVTIVKPETRVPTLFTPRKATLAGASLRAPAGPGVVVDPGMYGRSLRGNREISGSAIGAVVAEWSVAGR
jgi:hypothetical protein